MYMCVCVIRVSVYRRVSIEVGRSLVGSGVFSANVFIRQEDVSVYSRTEPVTQGYKTLQVA